MPQKRAKGKRSEMKGFWLVLLCNQPPRKLWASVYTCPWSLRWKTFTPRPMHGWRWSRTLIFSSFLLGEMDCLLWGRFVFLGEKRVFPGPFICRLHCQDAICYRNLNAFRPWLQNTQINFLGEKKRAAPEGLRSLSSSCSDAIDFIVKPEQRGSREFHEVKRMHERSHYLSMFTECLNHRLENISLLRWPWLTPSSLELSQWLTFKKWSCHKILVLLVTLWYIYILSFPVPDNGFKASIHFSFDSANILIYSSSPCHVLVTYQ